MKKILFFVGVLCCISSYSQSVLHVFEDWSTTLGSQSFFHKNVTKTDVSNNVYIAGATLNSLGDYDILVAKYNSSGVLQWVNQRAGTNDDNDAAIDLVVDNSGNVFITGEIVNDTTGFSDIITIKYNSSGVQQWLSTWNGAANGSDAGASLILDASGNVYVGGGTMNSSGNSDMVGIKYNSSGTQQFATTYNGTPNLNDAVLKCTLNATQVLLGGPSQQDTITFKQLAVRLNISTGAFVSATLGPAGSTLMDQVNDVAKDAAGNFYIVGGVPTLTDGYNINVIKLSSGMALTWQSTYNGADDLDDVAMGVKVDVSGNVYITGYTTDSTEQKNFITIKYNSSGVQQWVETYNDPLNGNDSGNDIDIDASGNIYVTGYDSTALMGTDYYTIKYDNSGSEIWNVRQDGIAHKMDKATNIVLDSNGDVIIAGESQKFDGSLEYKTVKYVEENIIVPTESITTDTVSSYMAYFENKGQLLSVYDTLVPEVRYYTNFSSPEYFIGDRKWSVVFVKADTVVATMDTLCRIDLGFTGNVNTNAKVYPLDKLRNYSNYFFAHIPDGITGVHGNARLVTPSLYPNVDLEYSSNQKGFKYCFIVKPGGSPTGIQLEFTGASSCSLNGTTNALTISSHLGSITFRRPTVYQISSTNTLIPITTWTADWQTNGASNKYKFNIGTYDNTKPLIIVIDEGIDPSPLMATIGNLSWSTYCGGAGEDVLTETAVGNNSDLYVAGNTKSPAFPGAAGTFQAVIATPGQDAVALRFDKLGVLLWTSYIGGTSFETSGGIAVNPITKKVYLVGSTLSSDFPTQSLGSALFDNTLGVVDGFICMFDSSALTAPWRTFYGGTGYDYFNDVKLDASNNIFIVGQAGSALTALTPSGAYTQTCIPGGFGSDNDALILKLNSLGVPQWISCYGGTSGGEFADRCAFDKWGSVYVVGQAKTPGTGFPTLNASGSADYYQSTLAGSGDAFIAKFGNSGNRLWATLYGGDSLDFASNVVVDTASGDIYVGGNTTSIDTTVMVTYNGGYHQALNAGGYDGFLLKMNFAHTRIWGTYFGGSLNDKVHSMHYDDDHVLYVTGETGSLTFPYYSAANVPTVFDQGYVSGTNGYVSAFDWTQKNVWCSYLGGAKTDVGYSIITDYNEQLFVVGKTNSDTASTPSFPLANGGGVPYFCGYWKGAMDGTVTRFDVKGNFYIGMDEFINSESSLMLYPNPGNDYLNVLLKNEGKSNITLRMFDILGKEIQSKDLGWQNGDIFHTFDITGLSTGVYFLQAQCGNNFTNKKFIKQ